MQAAATMAADAARGERSPADVEAAASAAFGGSSAAGAAAARAARLAQGESVILHCHRLSLTVIP